jgi:ubiquitin-protein ligase
MRFATFIFHPNISPHTGNICIDVLKAQWKPEVTMAIVLGTIIHGLLLKPVPDDPLNA